MPMITVKVLDVTGNKQPEVQVPDDVAVQRILMVLLERMNMPKNDGAGQPLSYKLYHKRSGKQLKDDQSLADIGVSDGDVLRLMPEIAPGAE